MSRHVLALACAVIALGATRSASAQSVGNALSGPVTGDGAAPYFNPAAMALADSVLQLDLGASFIKVRYDATGFGIVENRPIAPVLTLGGFTDALHRSVRLGVTVGLPSVGGGTWDTDADAAPVTRYYLVDATILHIGVSPALSWTPAPWITVGLGAQLVYGSTESMVDKDFGAQLNSMSGCSYERDDCLFPYADPVFAAPVAVNSSGFGVGGTFGLLMRPSPMIDIGASVQTPVRINTPGRIDVVYPDTLVAAVRDLAPSVVLPPLNATTNSSMDLPWAVHVGITARPIPKLELSLYYRWDNTSAAPFWEVNIEEASSPSIQDTGKIQGYKDRHYVRLRAGYAAREDVGVSLFGSFQSNTVPESTATPNNMDFNRIELGLLATWRVSERVGLLAQYSHLFLVSRDVSQSLHRPITDPAFMDFNHPRPLGRWSGHSDSIRLSVQVLFDRDE